MITDQQVDNFNQLKVELLRQLEKLEDWCVDVGNVSFLKKSLSARVHEVQESLGEFNRQIRHLGLFSVKVVSDVQPLASLMQEIRNIENLDYEDRKSDKF